MEWKDYIIGIFGSNCNWWMICCSGIVGSSLKCISGTIGCY